MDIKPRQIALVGLNLNPHVGVNSWKSSAPDKSPWGNIKIEVIHLPEFFREVSKELKAKNPANNSMPETQPLLRAIQYAMFYYKS